MGEKEFSKYMDRRSTNPEVAMSRLQEGELSEEERRERLLPNVRLIIKAHQADLVPQVKKLLEKHHGNPESVPEDEYEELGERTLGYEGLMIKMIAEKLVNSSGHTIPVFSKPFILPSEDKTSKE